MTRRRRRLPPDGYIRCGGSAPLSFGVLGAVRGYALRRTANHPPSQGTEERIVTVSSECHFSASHSKRSRNDRKGRLRFDDIFAGGLFALLGIT